MTVWGIVVAAGRGTRFGGAVPKQYRMLGDRRVVDWSVAAMRAAADATVLVVGPADDPGPVPDGVIVVIGGPTRTESVANGLAAIPADAAVDVIVVHDGARPLASAALFARVIDAVRAGAEAAVPALPLTDTVKRVAGDVVVETVDRDALVAVQTPQAFRASSLRAAHTSGLAGTDDAALIEATGGRVVVVPGEIANLKITSTLDLDVAALHLAR